MLPTPPPPRGPRPPAAGPQIPAATAPAQDLPWYRQRLDQVDADQMHGLCPPATAYLQTPAPHPVTAEDWAAHVLPWVWACTRQHLPFSGGSDDLRPLLALDHVELPDIPLGKGAETRQWLKSTFGEGMRRDNPVMEVLAGPQGALLWPPIDIIIDADLHLIEIATKLLTGGLNKTAVVLELRERTGLPHALVKLLISVAVHSAESYNDITAGEIIAGGQADLQLATSQSDVRARVAARKNLAQFSGHAKPAGETGVGSLVDALDRLLQGRSILDDDQAALPPSDS